MKSIDKVNTTKRQALLELDRVRGDINKMDDDARVRLYVEYKEVDGE